MSDPNVKGVKRSPSRPASRQTSTTSPAKNRTLSGKAAHPKPLVKRSTSEKAPARKATKTAQPASSKSKTTKKPVKSTQARKAVASKPKPATKGKQATTTKPAPANQPKKSVPTASKSQVRQPTSARPATARRPATVAISSAPRQPSRDEAAALRDFERAHKEFVRGHFGEARNLFRRLVEKHSGVSEVAARARTYLAIAESRLRTESSLPRDADSLYDRGVIELNRGEYVAAQEMFERALKREPEAAYIHYGLAAARARLGSVESSMQSLQRALDLQPSLRVRAQHDQDLTALRNDPEFERIVFASRY